MDASPHHRLQSLISYVQEDGRICPQPIFWNELWEQLPDRRRIGLSWEPELPLVLSAWWDSSPYEKRTRLIEHLQWASARGALEVVDRFLRGLSREHWFHESD